MAGPPAAGRARGGIDVWRDETAYRLAAGLALDSEKRVGADSYPEVAGYLCRRGFGRSLGDRAVACPPAVGASKVQGYHRNNGHGEITTRGRMHSVAN